MAALSVLVAHAYSFNHVGAVGPAAAEHNPLVRLVTIGHVGVFLFFALTGYLLYWPFVKHYFGGGDRIDLRRYALNRALRIVPLYMTAIVVVTLLSFQGGSLNLWARNLTFTQNFSQFTASKVDPPIWSVVVEVHFYLLLPLIAIGIALISRRRLRNAFITVTVVALVAFFARSFLVSGGADPYGLWRLNLPGTFLFFVPGFFLALLRLRLERRRPGWLGGRWGAANAWLLLSALLIAVIVWRPQVENLAVPLACFFAVGACVLPLRPGKMTSALRWRPLAALGIASYSLYIWHVPVIMLLRDQFGIHRFTEALPVAGALAIATAFVSYRLIEEPFLQLRKQWSDDAATKDAAYEARPSPKIA